LVAPLTPAPTPLARPACPWRARLGSAGTRGRPACRISFSGRSLVTPAAERDKPIFAPRGEVELQPASSVRHHVGQLVRCRIYPGGWVPSTSSASAASQRCWPASASACRRDGHNTVTRAPDPRPSHAFRSWTTMCTSTTCPFPRCVTVTRLPPRHRLKTHTALVHAIWIQGDRVMVSPRTVEAPQARAAAHVEAGGEGGGGAWGGVVCVCGVGWGEA
jgi:hypothetical protein